MLCYRDGSLEPLDGYPGRRGQIAAAFARYFDGAAVDGPPWRVSPYEDDRPTAAEYLDEPADFPTGVA